MIPPISMCSVLILGLIQLSENLERSVSLGSIIIAFAPLDIACFIGTPNTLCCSVIFEEIITNNSDFNKFQIVFVADG